jgi:NAD(P)-dependent dehydrogenase (short-subunit alcohol dehydrogenase family)
MKAIVTGAASGIGRATALRLVQDAVKRTDGTAEVLLVDLQADRLAETAALIGEAGGVAYIAVANLTDPESINRVIQAAQDVFGGVSASLDVLVSNAGIIERGTLLETTADAFDRAFAINTRATFLLACAAHPMLARARGCIVATASISAIEPTPPLGGYSASKAALVMLVRQMSVEWGPDGIRCNCISPGSTHTGMTDVRYRDPSLREAAAQRNPSRMVGSPANQAAAIAFLASPDAAYINGANLVVDGGLQNMLMVASAMGDPWVK